MEKLLSVIVPAYNEEENISLAVERISAVLHGAGIYFELVFVNDGSVDNTWEQICAVSELKNAELGYRMVRGICFSKNFGKEAAIFAGLEAAKGEAVVVIDCDMQHPPEKIVEMYRLWEQGIEVIEAVKADRGKESKMHSFGAKTFYKVISRAVGIDMSHASDFKLLDRKAVNVLLNMREQNVFFRALSSWIGFSTAQVEFYVEERQKGASKWSPWSLAKYAVRNITSFSSFPLVLIAFLGVLVLLVSIILGTVALYQKAAGIAQDGFTTVIVVLLFIGSILMISLGCIGYYIAKIYDEIKGRPRYIVSKECGEE